MMGRPWLIYALGHPLSVASGVWFIALAGAVSRPRSGLDKVIQDRRERGQMRTESDLCDALIEGAVQRVRPRPWRWPSSSPA